MAELLSGGSTNKIRASCDRCQGSKVKCSGTKPACWRCSQSGQTCVYSPFRRIGRPPKAAGALAPANSSRDRQATRKSKRPRPPKETRCSPSPVGEDEDEESRQFDEQHAALSSIINGLVDSVHGTTVPTDVREDVGNDGLRNYPTSTATGVGPGLSLSMPVSERNFRMEATAPDSVELVSEDDPLAGMNLSEELFADMDMDLDLDFHDPLNFSPERIRTTSPSEISWPPIDTNGEPMLSPHYSFWYNRSSISHPLPPVPAPPSATSAQSVVGFGNSNSNSKRGSAADSELLAFDTTHETLHFPVPKFNHIATQQDSSLSNFRCASIVGVQASADELSTITTTALQLSQYNLDRAPDPTTVKPEQGVQLRHTDLHQQYALTIGKALANDLNTASEIQVITDDSHTTSSSAAASAPTSCRNAKHSHHHQGQKDCHAALAEQLGRLGTCDVESTDMSLDTLLSLHARLQHLKQSAVGCPQCTARSSSRATLLMMVMALNNLVGILGKGEQQRQEKTRRGCGAIECCIDDSNAVPEAGDREQETRRLEENGGSHSVIGTLSGTAKEHEGFIASTPSTTSNSISGIGSGGGRDTTITASSTRDMLSFLATDKPLKVGGFVVHEDEVKQTFLRRLLVLHLERLAETMAALEKEVESALRGVDYNVAKEMLRDMRKRAFFLRGRLALAG